MVGQAFFTIVILPSNVQKMLLENSPVQNKIKSEEPGSLKKMFFGVSEQNRNIIEPLTCFERNGSRFFVLRDLEQVFLKKVRTPALRPAKITKPFKFLA
jgi:hypothetical protein